MHIIQHRESVYDFFSGFDGIICENTLVKGCNKVVMLAESMRTFILTHNIRDKRLSYAERMHSGTARPHRLVSGLLER